METLATFFFVIFNVIGTTATYSILAIVAIGPAFLLGTAIFRLVTMSEGNDSFKKGYSQTEMLARARIYEAQLAHRQNSRK